MKAEHLFGVAKLLMFIVASCGLAHAQGKSSARTIEFIVPWGPGGGADQLARLLGQRLQDSLAAPLSVINYPGASGTIGIARLVNAPADGYSIAVLTGDTLAAVVSGSANAKLDELTALGVFVRQPSGLFVRSDSRYKTWQDVLAAQKSSASRNTVATTGPGSMDEMTVDHLTSRGLRLLSVPYPKPGERYAAVLGGHIDFLYEQAGDIRGHLEANALRPILFFADRRVEGFPEIAASAELGYELALTQFRAVVARQGVGSARLSVLTSALERYARSDEFNAYLRQQLALPNSYIAASQARDFLRSELESMERLMSGGAGRYR